MTGNAANPAMVSAVKTAYGSRDPGRVVPRESEPLSSSETGSGARRRAKRRARIISTNGTARRANPLR
jgi:non-canonical (house-cleaning) NTP pyrophosphatase